MYPKYPSLTCSILILCPFFSFIKSATKPNIILIIADDLGWNDVGFHGSNQIATPNIDALAYNGIILNGHYVQSTGTATRASLFTGKYPIKIGMQGPSIRPAENISLPSAKLLPEFMKDLGYDTYLVGTWGLGYSRWNDTPLYRGFDHHFGSFNSYTDYYEYVTNLKINGKYYNGFDLRRDLDSAWDIAGTYATDAVTNYATEVISNQGNDKPLFIVISHYAAHSGNEGKLLDAPPESIQKHKHVIDNHRRIYAGMVSKLDDSVGKIVDQLEKSGHLQNSVIIFISDNGSPGTSRPFPNWGSNYPLRGLKGTLFEGGLRSVSFIWSPLIIQNAKVSTELIHVSDWLPTIVSAGGGELSLLDAEIDGIDLWSSLIYDFPSPRNEILLNIDEVTRCAALRFYNWKLIVGNPEANETSVPYDGEDGLENIEPITYNISAILHCPAGQAISKISYSSLREADFHFLRQQATIKCSTSDKTKSQTCDLSSGEVCLFDIPNDPCEKNNLANFFPSVVRRMKRAMVDYKSVLIPQQTRSFDIENANSKLFQFTWNPWLDCANPSCAPE